MKPSEEICAGMEEAGIDFVCTLPCGKAEKTIDLIKKKLPSHKITREEEGVGICAGAYLAGKKPAIFIQNSGIGNSINALKSLNEVFSIPLLILVSHRGGPEEKISAQIPMGEATKPILDTLGIQYYELETPPLKQIIREATNHAFENQEPVAVLLRGDALE